MTETWFLRSETGEESAGGKLIRLYEIEGYKSFFSSKMVHSAGLALYVRDGCDFEMIDRSCENISFIHRKLRVTNERREKTLLLTLLYMPRLQDHPKLFDVLEKILYEAPLGSNHVLMGDHGCHQKLEYLGFTRISWHPSGTILPVIK